MLPISIIDSSTQFPLSLQHIYASTLPHQPPSSNSSFSHPHHQLGGGSISSTPSIPRPVLPPTMPTNGINNRHTLGQLAPLYSVVWTCSLITSYCNLSSGRRLSSTSVPVPPTPTSLTSSGASPTEICKCFHLFYFFLKFFSCSLLFCVSWSSMKLFRNWSCRYKISL